MGADPRGTQAMALRLPLGNIQRVRQQPEQFRQMQGLRGVARLIVEAVGHGRPLNRVAPAYAGSLAKPFR